MNKLRVAVIGIGNMGSAHARHILEGKVRDMGKNIYTKEFDNGFKKTNINYKKKKGTTKPTKQQMEEMKWRKDRDEKIKIICDYIDKSFHILSIRAKFCFCD